jgi:hypothetical protein
MKKAALIVLGVWLFGGVALAAAGVRVEVKGAFYSSADANFRDIYGGAMKFGLEGGLGISKNLAAWAGLDYVHKTGTLAISNEETKVSIIPVSAGVRYEIPYGEKLRFHVGAGLQMVLFSEDAPLGTTSKSGFGLIATAGGMYQVSSKVSAGLFINWSTCSMTNEDVEFKVGGLDIGVGIEFRL